MWKPRLAGSPSLIAAGPYCQMFILYQQTAKSRLILSLNNVLYLICILPLVFFNRQGVQYLVLRPKRWILMKLSY